MKELEILENAVETPQTGDKAKSVYFIIKGDLVGKGRPRVSTRGGFVTMYTPSTTTAYEKQVVMEYINAVRKLGKSVKDPLFQRGTAVKAYIKAYTRLPQSYSGVRKQRCLSGEQLPTIKPDADNIIKIILDALNKVAFHDDAQVIEVIYKKAYAYQPKVLVELTEILPNK